MKNNIKINIILLIILIQLFYFRSDNGITASQSQSFFIDDFVAIVDNNLTLMPTKDISEMSKLLNIILSGWKGSSFSPSDIFSYRINVFFEAKINEISQSSIKMTDIFNLNYKFIRDREASYNNLEKKYAIGNNDITENTDQEVIYMYTSTLKKIKKIKNLSGNYVISKSNHFYSYSYLRKLIALDYYDIPPKRRFYLTNNFIIDDTPDIPIENFIRGGLTNAIYDKRSGAILLSNAIFYTPSSLIDIRNREIISSKTKILAYLIAHEIGHCYLNLDNDYQNKHSIMYPVHKFEYLEWIRNIESAPQ